MFEDTIDCLDLPGIKETFDKVENELPDSKYLLQDLVTTTEIYSHLK